MTAAGTETCDGCDREGPAQQLEEVILPSGSMVVCPECRYHAEELAERSTADCEGCGEGVTAATLARTELPDGTEMILCPECQDAVSAGERPAGATSTTDEEEKEDASTARRGSEPDASSGNATGTTAAGSPTDGPTPEEPTASTSDANCATATGTASNAGEAVTDGATGKPATTNDTCDQCGGLFSIELYQVVTVDGRTEQFCPDCKDDGLENGIVRDVELRRAQAYEVLGLEWSASSDDVRQSYLEQVKEVHPDRADGSRSEFMLVQQAYERLRDD
ncbi:hypothetical protein GCM10028857_00850 [Salinarchaeum chitinilyticum]